MGRNRRIEEISVLVMSAVGGPCFYGLGPSRPMIKTRNTLAGTYIHVFGLVLNIKKNKGWLSVFGTWLPAAGRRPHVCSPAANEIHEGTDPSRLVMD